MSKHSTFVLSAGLSGVALVCGIACGSADKRAETPDGAAPTSDAMDVSSEMAPDFASACVSYGAAYCSRLQRCDAITLGLLYGTVQTCVERTAPLCPDRFTAPGATVTPGALADCAAALPGQTCFDMYTAMPTVCTWRGSLMNAAPCEYSSQCQSGFCNLAGGTWCGLCEPVPGLGVVCDPNQSICQHALLCADTGCTPPVADGGACQGTRQWVCSAPVTEGGPCSTSAECIPADLACRAGICSQAVRAGDPCDFACATSQNLACLSAANGTGNVCTPVTFASIGQACDVRRGVLCAGGARCRDAAGTAAVIGTCTAPAADGASCSNGITCVPPALCIQGACRASLPASSCN